MKLNRIPSLVNEFLNSQNKKNCIKIRETGSSLSSYKYKLEKEENSEEYKDTQEVNSIEESKIQQETEEENNDKSRRFEFEENKYFEDKINQYEADDKLATYYIKAITTIKDHCSSQTIKGINGVLNLFKNCLSQLRDKNTDKNLFNDEKMEEINVIVLYHVLKNKLME